MTNQITTTPTNRENLILRMPFVNSEQSCIVRAYHQPKIRNIESDEPIRQVLRYIFTLIGIRAENIPNDIQKSVLINYIQNDLKHYSVDDFKIAFHLMLKNELDCESNHYQNFNPMYLAQVMNAYNKHRQMAIHEFKKLEMEQQQMKQNELSPEQLLQKTIGFYRNCIINPFNFFIKTGEITFGIIPFSVIYESMVDDLRLFELTDEQKNVIYKQAKTEINNELKRETIHSSIEQMRKIRDLREKIEQIGIESALKTDIITRCHKISITKFFESCKKNNIDLPGLIEDKIKIKQQQFKTL
jgi:hypothetical protein